MTIETTIRASAEKAIDKYGKTVIYNKITQGVYDPATSAATPSVASKTIKAIIEDNKGFRAEDGLIKVADKKISIAASLLAMTPEPSDTVKLDGSTYTIKSVKTIYAGELAALYELYGVK